MSARRAAPLAALALAACAVTVPLQKPPPQIDWPRAPIETAGPQFASVCKDWDDWAKPAPPVRVHANTYYVGTCGISAILVTGTAGHILVDSGPEEAAELVIENIRALGFNPADVRILLHSHEHHDHVGGMARLKQLTGAQLYASADAASVFATGRAVPGDPQAGVLKAFPPAAVDRIVMDGEAVRLGNLMLTAVATPGHTQGALSWHWVSCDGGVCRTIVYADSLSPVSGDTYRFTDHPALLEDFRKSISKVAALDCDILLTPHPSASDMVDRFAGRAPLENANACRDYAADITKRLDERLAKEKAGK